jgi:hypothetical protein
MREETIRCDECKEIVAGEVYVLPEMIVHICSGKGKKNVEQIVMVGPGATVGGKPPDFCGVPCMTKWIYNKLNGGTKGGDAF